MTALALVFLFVVGSSLFVRHGFFVPIVPVEAEKFHTGFVSVVTITANFVLFLNFENVRKTRKQQDTSCEGSHS